MSSKKGKSNAKKQKKAVIVEKQVPDFIGIYDAILDSYAFMLLAYRALEECQGDEERGCAIVSLQHGTEFLKQVSERFEAATMKLWRFCKQRKLPQEGQP